MTVNGTAPRETDQPEESTTAPGSKPTEPQADDPSDAGGAGRVRRRRANPPAAFGFLSVRTLAVGAVIVALVAAIAVLGWLYVDARSQLNAQTVQSANDAKAEKIALDYAVNAATMDYKDLQGWQVKLVAGTGPELNKKLTDAATSMEQVLVPLQWSSTAQPLVAKVRSTNGGIYVVDSFVSVKTKTVQAPEALQSTATYSTTIDSNSNWQITDVGGIGSAMGPK